MGGGRGLIGKVRQGNRRDSRERKRPSKKSGHEVLWKGGEGSGLCREWIMGCKKVRSSSRLLVRSEGPIVNGNAWRGDICVGTRAIVLRTVNDYRSATLAPKNDHLDRHSLEQDLDSLLASRQINRHGRNTRVGLIFHPRGQSRVGRQTSGVDLSAECGSLR